LCLRGLVSKYKGIVGYLEKSIRKTAWSKIAFRSFLFVLAL
jgi:hypothetical protein